MFVTYMQKTDGSVDDSVAGIRVTYGNEIPGAGVTSFSGSNGAETKEGEMFFLISGYFCLASMYLTLILNVCILKTIRPILKCFSLYCIAPGDASVLVSLNPLSLYLNIS